MEQSISGEMPITASMHLARVPDSSHSFGLDGMTIISQSTFIIIMWPSQRLTQLTSPMHVTKAEIYVKIFGFV